MSLVRYFDGNRWRLGFHYTNGPRYASLLDLGRLRAVTLPKAEARHFRPVDGTTAQRQRLARSIEQQSACFRRNKRRHAASVVKRVAAQLRQA